MESTDVPNNPGTLEEAIGLDAHKYGMDRGDAHYVCFVRDPPQSLVDWMWRSFNYDETMDPVAVVLRIGQDQPAETMHWDDKHWTLVHADSRFKWFTATATRPGHLINANIVYTHLDTADWCCPGSQDVQCEFFFFPFEYQKYRPRGDGGLCIQNPENRHTIRWIPECTVTGHENWFWNIEQFASRVGGTLVDVECLAVGWVAPETSVNSCVPFSPFPRAGYQRATVRFPVVISASTENPETNTYTACTVHHFLNSVDEEKLSVASVPIDCLLHFDPRTFKWPACDRDAYLSTFVLEEVVLSDAVTARRTVELSCQSDQNVTIVRELSRAGRCTGRCLETAAAHDCYKVLQVLLEDPRCQWQPEDLLRHAITHDTVNSVRAILEFGRVRWMNTDLILEHALSHHRYEIVKMLVTEHGWQLKYRKDLFNPENVKFLKWAAFNSGMYWTTGLLASLALTLNITLELQGTMLIHMRSMTVDSNGAELRFIFTMLKRKHMYKAAEAFLGRMQASPCAVRDRLSFSFCVGNCLVEPPLDWKLFNLVCRITDTSTNDPDSVLSEPVPMLTLLQPFMSMADFSAHAADFSEYILNVSRWVVVTCTEHEAVRWVVEHAPVMDEKSLLFLLSQCEARYVLQAYNGSCCTALATWIQNHQSLIQ